MDLELAFGDKTIVTPVYLKMDAADQLLLSEGVCSQLGIVSYDANVKLSVATSNPSSSKSEDAEGPVEENKQVVIPMVRVRLLHALTIPPLQRAFASVQLSDGYPRASSLLLEGDPSLRLDLGVQVEDALLNPSVNGHAKVSLWNSSGFTQTVDEGAEVGKACQADLVAPAEVSEVLELARDMERERCRVDVVTVSRDDEEHKKKLLKMVEEPDLPDDEKSQLLELLSKHHGTFSVEPGDRGETDLTQIVIDTGEVSPRRQPVRRVPFAVRQEIASHLDEMQKNSVIEPSKSPWASPVVLVRKKDGSHRFCIDYRALNAVTKQDTYPIPRISDLLDQLGESRFFSTLDLASGFWQIKVHPDSQEKTAFVTPQGLFEFKVMPFGLCNAPAVFQRLMQQVLMGLNPPQGPDFVSVYIDDVLVFSKTFKEHLQHLRQVIDRLEKAGLKLKPSKCHFARKEVEYLGHVITPQGVKTNPKLVEAVRDFQAPRDVKGLRRFLGMSSYYRKFIPNFAKVAEPLHRLTRKDVVFKWSPQCQEAFTTLKRKLTEAPVLAYPAFGQEFVLETDASISGLGAVLSQKQADGKIHPIAYASRSLNTAEKNYGITELETLAVVWAVSHYHSYLYGHDVTVLTDHSAIKSVLGAPTLSGKHARWWTRVYGRGVKNLKIQFRSGRENLVADSLSRSPTGIPPTCGEAESEFQVAHIEASSITELLEEAPSDVVSEESLRTEQLKDPFAKRMIHYLENDSLPTDDLQTRKLVGQATQFALLDGILYFIDAKRDSRRRAVVPSALKCQVMEEVHGGKFGGHFSGPRTYNSLAYNWWWERMYSDVISFCKNCPQCAIVSGTGRRCKPPLCPISIERPFQIFGLDIMELPKTDKGNKYAVVFMDLFTKWPFVYATPDQKSLRIAKLLVDEIVPFCGVPEALLTDRGTNLLSHLMLDLCEMLGTKKLNTTAYHPQCDGMVERFNRTLKSMIRKHVAKFGERWDDFLPGIVWAYRNTPHESSGEKPSFLLFGTDCRSPTEAALLSSSPNGVVDVLDYREEVALSLSSARSLAAQSIRKAQSKYKIQYDKRSTDRIFKRGEWILIKFPQDESGPKRKLSRPWRGPFRVISCRGPNIVASKVYFPEDNEIQVHQTRVCACPAGFPAGFYWYGGKRRSPGRPPKWVEQTLEELDKIEEVTDDPDDPVTEEETGEQDEEDVAMHTQSNVNFDDDPLGEELESGLSASPPVVVPRSTRTRTRTVIPPDRLMYARVELV